ncbi:MAG: trp operon repressor [Burkholderiales bacterium]|nr:trp operon repressor [Burkholderiales bacterium]
MTTKEINLTSSDTSQIYGDLLKENIHMKLVLEKFSKLKTTKELFMFFEIFLTYTEREEFIKRFRIMHELINGKKTQREIARDLKVSIANVSRGSNVLKTLGKSRRAIFIDLFKD